MCNVIISFSVPTGAKPVIAPFKGCASVIPLALANLYSEDLEKWYQEVMKDDEVDSEGSYLTRWDPETEQVVVVQGKDPGLYDEFSDEEASE